MNLGILRARKLAWNLINMYKDKWNDNGSDSKDSGEGAIA